MRILFCLAVLAAPWAAPAVEESSSERFIPRPAAGEVYYLWSSRAAFTSVGSGSVQVQEAGARAPVVLFEKAQTRFSAGVDWRWNRLDFHDSPALRGARDLYRLQVPLDVWQTFADRWKAWCRVEPGMFTDLENIGGDAFAVTVLALGSYQFTPAFSVAFGVYYSRDLGEDRVLPALGVVWQPDPHWRIDLTFPRASLSYAPTGRWVFTAALRPGGAGWSITDPATGDRRRLNYKSWHAAITAECEIATVGAVNCWAFLTAGYQFGQKVTLKDGDTELFETDLEAGQFVSAGLRTRF